MIIMADTGETWSFSEVGDYSGRLANLLLSRGHRKGDVIAVFMTNRPEYVAVELGLAKAGIVGALINNNLRGEVRYSCHRVVNFASCSHYFRVSNTV